jgi:cell shape-determining protein MreD
MQLNSYTGFFRVILTLVFAMCLRIAPWQGEMAAFNPDWVLLVLIYWSLAIPDRVGIFHAWIFGLFTDVLTGRNCTNVCVNFQCYNRDCLSFSVCYCLNYCFFS